ncbi:metal-dependent hydrolase [Polyangium aurulentum]|uniref:metal-dependent hydrolase n=1 Tax=Polyangium aurulentum TaxID=2567896 RepID=UPI0010AE6431|nr:metal-dependent hydrolase [Polyangium aurulentum]UQA62994.1 metal-dependent hydrolase [Polyangium aurulentum]
MASLGHIAVGMAAARLEGGGLARMVGWSALSLLPDADVIAFQLGIPYSAPFGHRGASHSFVAAAAVGLLVGLASKRSKRARTGLLAFATVASHGLLDTLTDGGLGMALLWPFTNARYFAPWRPIPVAPIGLGVLSQRGFYVMAVELAMFSPLFLYALWPRRRR